MLFSKGKRVCILMAAYNEDSVIGNVIASLGKLGFPVVVVDDGSTDATGESASKGGAVVLRHIVNRGKGAALQTGTDYILRNGGEIIVHFDADGQHHADDIPLLIAPILAGNADAVFGSRFLGTAENIPFLRKILLKAGLIYTNVSTGGKMTDVHNGLRAFSSAVFRKIRLTEDRFAYASELIEKVVSGGFKIVEVPVKIIYTPYSVAKGQKNSNALNILFRHLWRKYHL